jgi:predicted lipoprotein with Yx(FWY)xxD motif
VYEPVGFADCSDIRKGFRKHRRLPFGSPTKGDDVKKTLTAVAIAAATLVAGALANAGEGNSAPLAAERAQAPATLTLRMTRFGRVLFDSRGRVLYAFTRDRRRGPSRCYGGCARAWPVYFAKGTMRAARGVRQSLIGTTRRRDGRRQVTYNGWPLYFYAHEGPGEVKCQNVDQFGGLWLVVRSNGTLVR